jgi:hypothetical protein
MTHATDGPSCNVFASKHLRVLPTLRRCARVVPVVGHVPGVVGQLCITLACSDSTERHADSTAPSIHAGSRLATAQPM